MDELNAEYQKLAQQAQAWIEAVTGKTFPDGDFIDNLTDGVMLCRCVWERIGSGNGSAGL